MRSVFELHGPTTQRFQHPNGNAALRGSSDIRTISIVTLVFLLATATAVSPQGILLRRQMKEILLTYLSQDFLQHSILQFSERE